MNSHQTPTDVQNVGIILSLDGIVKGETKFIPKIRINKDQVPIETRNIYLILEDLDFLNFPHGAELLAFQGSDILLENVFPISPLNPPIGSHRYQLTVRALDENNQIIGVGKAIKQFP